MRIYGAIHKIEDEDDGTIRVHGIASTEDVDNAGEIVRADAMRAAIPGYARFPALREMHGLSAAGTTTEIEVGDDNITRIVAKVVDPVAIAKCRSLTYRGFSIGGRVLKRDPSDRKIITGIDLKEISLVDRPCNENATMSLLKAGGVDLTDSDEAAKDQASDEAADEAQEVEKAAETEIASTEEGQETIIEPEIEDTVVVKLADGTEFHIEPDSSIRIKKRKFSAKDRKKDAKNGDAEADGSFPIESKQDLRNAIRAYGRSKNKAATKRHIIARARALGASDLIPDDWKDTKKVTSPADAETGDQLAKAGETTAAPISPSAVGDVMGDGAGNADSQTPGAPVAGARVMANFPPGGSPADHQAVDTENAATAGNDGQDKLDTSDTPIVEHVAAETPTAGTDTRTHVHPEGNKAADSDPISAAREAAEKALKSANESVEKATAAVGGSPIPAPLRAGAELRKSLGTVARLGYLLSELAYILSDVRYEAEYEADDSPVPEQLRAAIAPLAAVYRAMSEEEISELMSQVDAKTASALAAAVSGGDAMKAFAVIADPEAISKLAPIDEQLAKRDTEIAGLKGNVQTLLTLNGDLTKGLGLITKRMDELAAMPMPAKTLTAAAPVETVIKAVTKEEDTAGITKADAATAAPAISMNVEDFQKAWDALPAETRAEMSLRASLQRPIPINR
jgi:hypothetical protein